MKNAVFSGTNPGASMIFRKLPSVTRAGRHSSPDV